MEKEHELKKLFEEAWDIVKNLDESVRQKAFEVAVDQLTGKSDEKEESSTEQTQTDPDFWESMSKATGLVKNALEIIYHMDKSNQFNVNDIRLTGKNNAEQQKELAYVYLLAKRYGTNLNEGWVSAADFGKLATRFNINDGNIKKNLTSTPRGHIITKGELKGTQYIIGPQGIDPAIKILKDHANISD